MFKLIRSENIEGLGTAFEYNHSSGAKVIYVENEDINRVFTIAFNTLPDNDKGIPHIVEHCVLCGSENFSVKDPFNILDKGSIHTYLNAMTYRDKTVYPVGSTNEADFKTLMRVYCDAVFKPLMYKNEGIFRQEGWNSDGKEYNGIVLNEMKGVYSDPAVVLSEIINKEMFKGSNYANDAGGNPDYITDLSYEEFLDFHKKHYHPSNSVIYLYGKLDINEYFDILDNEFLGDFEYRERVIPKRVICKNKLDIVHRYNTKGKNILTVVYDTGSSEDAVKCLMLGILSTLWCYVEGGNIKDALLNAGLGDKVSCGFDDSGLSSVMDITVENSDEVDTVKFKEVINNAFKEIAQKGVDEYKLRGVINSIKFFFKEEDFGYKPKGLFYGLLIIKSFLSGYDNFEFVKTNKLFSELENVDIKEIVNKYFVDKGCFGILIADAVEKSEKAVAPKNNESLAKYQAMEDKPEEVKKLMSTKVSDIAKEGYKLVYEAENDDIFVPLEEGDIVYIDICFDVTGFENGVALNTFRTIADMYNESLSNDIDYYMGGFSIEVTSLHKNKSFRPIMSFRMKCLKENTEKCIELFERCITQIFEDKDKISRLISETRQSIKNGYVESGNSRAVGEALAMVSGSAAWESKAKGIAFYNYLNEDIDKIVEDINTVKNIFREGSAFYSIACGKEDKDKVIGLVKSLIERLEKGGSKNILDEFQLGKSKGIIIDSNVNFNAVAFGIDGSSGIARVAQQIIAREYIWDKIRIEGGAYGGSCVFGKNYSYMYSYRDPNFDDTFSAFKNVGEYLADKKYSQEDIDRFIIGTINDIDKPVKKHTLTHLALRKHFADEEPDFALHRREQILGAKPRDINSFGELLKMANIKGIASVGMEKDLKNCQIFKEMYRIH